MQVYKLKYFKDKPWKILKFNCFFFLGNKDEFVIRINQNDETAKTNNISLQKNISEPLPTAKSHNSDLIENDMPSNISKEKNSDEKKSSK